MKLVTIGFLTLLFAATPSWAIVIDDYDAGAYALGNEGLTPPSLTSDTQLDPGGTHILGGRRDVTFSKSSGTPTQPYCNVIPGILFAGFTGVSTFNSSFNCNAVWTTTYGLAADLNVDLTDNGQCDVIVLELISGDMDNSVPQRPVPATITVVSGTGTHSVTLDLIAEGSYEYPYAAFPGVDFTDVDRIEVVIEQDSTINDAVDFALGELVCSSLVVPVEATTWGSIKQLYRD